MDNSSVKKTQTSIDGKSILGIILFIYAICLLIFIYAFSGMWSKNNCGDNIDSVYVTGLWYVYANEGTRGITWYARLAPAWLQATQACQVVALALLLAAPWTPLAVGLRGHLPRPGSKAAKMLQ